MPSTFSGQQPPRFGKMRNIAQLISGALIVSLIVLSVVVYVAIDMVPETNVAIAPNLLYIGGAALSLLCAVAGWMMPHLMMRSLPKSQLALHVSGFAYSRVLFSACFEAAGLFWAVLALILKQPICLAGPAVAAIVMISQFPTQARMEEALEMREDAVDRALGHED